MTRILGGGGVSLPSKWFLAIHGTLNDAQPEEGGMSSHHSELEVSTSLRKWSGVTRGTALTDRKRHRRTHGELSDSRIEPGPPQFTGRFKFGIKERDSLVSGKEFISA